MRPNHEGRGDVFQNVVTSEPELRDLMGVPSELAECALRISLGWNSTRDDIAAFLGSQEGRVRAGRPYT